MKLINKNLKYLRIKNNLTQPYIEMMIGEAHGMYCAWEKGICAPSHRALRKLTVLFVVSIDWMVRKDLSKLTDGNIHHNYSEIQKKLV